MSIGMTSSLLTVLLPRLYTLRVSVLLLCVTWRRVETRQEWAVCCWAHVMINTFTQVLGRYTALNDEAAPQIA